MEAIKYYTSNNLSESMLSLLKENTMVTVTDELGRLDYANTNFCKVLECEPDKIIGETHTLFKSHLHTGALYKSLWRTIKMGLQWKGILTETLPNGKVLWLDTTIVPIKIETEKYLKFLAIYKDITKHKEENNELKANKEKYRLFLNNMPMHVFSITKHGKILNTNKAFANNEITDLISNYIYDFINEKSFKLFKQYIDSVFTYKTPFQFECYDIDPKSKKGHYSILISPVFNELGVTISAILTIQEVVINNILNENLMMSNS